MTVLSIWENEPTLSSQSYILWPTHTWKHKSRTYPHKAKNVKVWLGFFGDSCQCSWGDLSFRSGLHSSPQWRGNFTESHCRSEMLQFAFSLFFLICCLCSWLSWHKPLTVPYAFCCTHARFCPPGLGLIDRGWWDHENWRSLKNSNNSGGHLQNTARHLSSKKKTQMAIFIFC